MFEMTTVFQSGANKNDQANLRRSILLGARIRFSPSGASIRSQAIERIIEQNLATSDAVEGLTEQELQRLIVVEGELAVLRPSDIRQGLQSLTQTKRVHEINDKNTSRYKLADDLSIQVKHIIAESEERTRLAIRELFGHAPGGESRYIRAFVNLLCSTFSRLSDVYVQVMTMQQTAKEFAEHQLLSAVLEETVRQERIPDQNAFRYGVTRFFYESSPLFDQIKWNMAQNFYVMKALGLDTESDLLSAEVFAGCSLYCDTNVLIPGLTPENRHHNSFQELAKACKTIGMDLKAAHPTVEELKTVIYANAVLLKRVIDKIPDEMQSKVRNFLLEAFLAERKQSPDVTLDGFIERFQAPLDTLREFFGLVEEDDLWFDSAAEDLDTKKLANDLSKTYEAMRGRRKSDKAATHDAVLLKWVGRENMNGLKSWLVTADMSLREWSTGQRQDNIRVITLDALLQWITPAVSGSADEDRLAKIFSEAIRFQLLPRDTFFQLRDFQVFAEMGVETKQLPVEDVEACIREIKKAGPQLDPSEAKDREKIGQVIQRYFADPGTKYQRTVDELRLATDKLAAELKDEARLRNAAEKKFQQLQKEMGERDSKLREESMARKDAEKRLANLERTIKDQESRARRTKLVHSAILRTILTLLAVLIIEGFIVFVVAEYGTGANLFQKLTNAWPWLTVGMAAPTTAYPFLMGRERMRLLKWWKGDADAEESQ
jgi:hypothetical protein